MVDIRKIYSAERQHDSRIYLNVVAQKAAAFFGSTDSAIYLLPSSKYFKKCVPEKSQARIFLFSADVPVCSGGREKPACRSPPLTSILPFNQKSRSEELSMKEINLRDYYPFYKKDTFAEVPEEIA